MKHRWFLSVFLIISLFGSFLQQICLAQSSNAQTAAVYEKQFAAIEEKIEKRRQELGIPGLSLAVVKDGQIIFIKGFGYKDFENKIPVTPDTQFAIGSITKSFTALSVLMTADEGKISLEDSPKKYLPYFKINDPVTDKNITVRDLMDHSSGLNRTDLAMLTGKLSRRELIELAGEVRPMAKLDQKFFYNNIMYSAAGELVSAVQGQSWEAFVQKRIFTPLEMNNSMMSIAEMLRSKDYSYGYEYNPETKATVKFPLELAVRPLDGVAAAGAITSSVRDMSKWINFVLNNGEINGNKLVSEKFFEEWLKPQNKVTPDGKMSYSFGWFLKDYEGLKGIGHGGNVPGFTSFAAMLPEKKLGFVMLTNVSASNFGNELTSMIFENLLGEKQPAQNEKSAQTTVENEFGVEKAIGKYRFEQLGIDVEIQQKNGKLLAIIPGQPVYELENIAGRKFKIANAPAGFFVTFNEDSLLLDQPQGKFTLPKLKVSAADPAQKPPQNLKIKADEIMSKAVEAIGGEAKLRKMTTREIVSEIDAVHQGIKGKSISYAKAPNRAATLTTMTALGKMIGKSLSYFDGTNGQEISSFLPVEKFSGKRLEDVRIESDFYNALNWKTNYQTAEVKGIEKVGEEDCYVVELTPEKGSKTTQYYSVNSFLLLKKVGVIISNTGQTEQYTLTFSDFRKVDGLQIPFKTVNFTSSMGDIISTVRSVKHNEKIEDNIFSPKELVVK